jgi:ABC-type sugar transport system substrate-binding protein
MTLPHRRDLLKLLPSAGIATLTGCGDSEEARVSRYEAAIETAKQELQHGDDQALSKAEAKKKVQEDELAAAEASKKVLLYCASNLAEPFQQVQADLLRLAVRTLEGCRVEVLDAKNDVGVQLDHLAQAQRQHPAWLIFQPVEEKLSAALLESMKNQGTKIIGLDQRLAPSACHALVFIDQKKLGQKAGEVVIEALKRKATQEGKPQVTGRVVQITGARGAATLARSEAFLNVLRTEPGIILVHDAPGDWSLQSGRERCEDALRLQGQLDVIFAHNDAMAQGASEALNTAQKRDQVLIVGIDAMGGREGGLDLLRRSVIDATVWQPMPLETSFLMIQRSLNEKAYQWPATTEREPEAVTPKTLDDFVKRLRG